MTGVAWVTGAGGFSGRHLVARLESERWRCAAPRRGTLDIRDSGALDRFVAETQPDAVFHLAALASVPWSWRHPRDAILANVEMTVNVLEAVRDHAPAARVLVASSGEVYGPPVRLPVAEDHPLRPQNPYAASKAACDILAGQAADGHGLAVVRTRAFNHAGPGQSEDYLLGAITRQLAEAEARGDRSVTIVTGNPDAERDFCDVRDVVAGYVAAVGCPPGIYNIASGRALSVRAAVACLAEVTELEVRHEVDPARMRRVDLPTITGDAGRLRAATGWKPEIALRQTLRDAVDAWRRALATALGSV